MPNGHRRAAYSRCHMSQPNGGGPAVHPRIYILKLLAGPVEKRCIVAMFQDNLRPEFCLSIVPRTA